MNKVGLIVISTLLIFTGCTKSQNKTPQNESDIAKTKEAKKVTSIYDTLKVDKCEKFKSLEDVKYIRNVNINFFEEDIEDVKDCFTRQNFELISAEEKYGSLEYNLRKDSVGVFLSTWKGSNKVGSYGKRFHISNRQKAISLYDSLANELDKIAQENPYINDKYKDISSVIGITNGIKGRKWDGKGGWHISVWEDNEIQINYQAPNYP